MDSMLQDIRYSLRGLRAAPGFAAVAIITLGLGIGVNAAIFSVVNAFLLRPLPVEDPGQLAVIATTTDLVEFPIGVGYVNYRDFRERSNVFEDIAIYMPTGVSLNVDGSATLALFEAVSANYFDMLGVRPTVGRTFSLENRDVPGTAPEIVLDHGFWQRRFGGDESVIGRSVKINEYPFVIIGVAPEDFRGTEFLFRPDAYLPAMMLGEVDPRMSRILENRRSTAFRALGRMAQGINAGQADAAMRVLGAELQAEFPEDNRDFGLMVAPETSARPEPSLIGVMPRIAGVFMALVALVLLIACANVAGLLLVRISARNKELAIRAALGAGRGRLFRQLVTDSIVLGALGGVVGLLLSLWAIRWMTATLNGWSVQGFNLSFDLAPDWRVILFAVVVAAFTGLVAGAVPALRLSRGRLVDTLREGGRSADPGRHGLRSALVVAQVAVSLILLIAAGLFLRSLQSARDVDLGFRSDDVLMMTIEPGLVGYDEPAAQQYYKDAIEQVRALPGVQAAGLASSVAFGGNTGMREVVPEASVEAPDEGRVVAVFYVAGDGYFEAAGTDIRAGRPFGLQDGADSRPVAIVNETLAELLWPGDSAVGKRFAPDASLDELYEVVGVAANSKVFMVWEESRPIYYRPLAQQYRTPVTVFVHTDQPAAIAGAVREELRALDPNMLLYNVITMDDHLTNGTAFLIIRFAAMMVGVFGAVGLLLAAVGLYGVVSFTVSQRTHEIGVRMALGAGVGNVLSLVLRRGLVLVAVGLVFGVIGALGMGQLMGSLLIGVGPRDPMTYGTVALFLATVAFAASLVPARRATAVDPVSALRDDA